MEGEDDALCEQKNRKGADLKSGFDFIRIPKQDRQGESVSPRTTPNNRLSLNRDKELALK